MDTCRTVIDNTQCVFSSGLVREGTVFQVLDSGYLDSRGVCNEYYILSRHARWGIVGTKTTQNVFCSDDQQNVKFENRSNILGYNLFVIKNFINMFI